MPCLYHLVPSHLIGTVLYPLNQLRDLDPALYEECAAKYLGREQLLEERIPLLGDCLWGDVIFLSPIHPVYFKDAFESCGPTLERPFRAYEFDIDSLDDTRLAVVTDTGTETSSSYDRYDRARYQEYASIPQRALDVWRDEHTRGVRSFLYQHIPHCLYRGSLETATVPIIET